MVRLGEVTYFYRDTKDHLDDAKATHFRSEILESLPEELPQLRNYLMSELSCWGAKEIRISENLSTLNDEIVADRLAMIPFGLATDGDYSLYHLKVENLDEDRMAVTTSMMTRVEGTELNFPNIVITYLLKQQKIDIYVVCDKGVGLENYRYTVVSSVSYPVIDGKRYLEVECLESIRPHDIFREAVKFASRTA